MDETTASSVLSRQDTVLSSIDINDSDSDFEYLTLPETDFDYIDSDDKNRTVDVPVKIPFSSIHKDPVKFDSNERKCFLPGRKIEVEICDVERAPPHTKILNPNLYIIRLKHGDAEWTIKRRYKHFRHLHERMMIIRAGLALSLPVPSNMLSKGHRKRRKSFLQRKQGLPKFPKMPDPLVRMENMDERKKQLEDYLQNLLRCPMFRNDEETLKFLEVSHLSFVNNLGQKRREGVVKKRSGGRRIKLGMCGCCQKLGFNCTAHWKQRWLIVKDTCVAYLSEDGLICDVLLMDSEFKTVCGISSTGTRHILLISNLSRHLLLKCWTARKAREWMDGIKEAAKTTGQDFTGRNRYSSFAPMRVDSHAQWFVDGGSYFSAVADALESAKEEIMITDWWLSPEIYMKRPITDGDFWRLDVILKRKADAGVKIFVLLYKEMELALGLNSFYTKQTLVRLNHDNIKVLRHPDGISLWAHHEKTVIVDQKIGFIGGIDLCYGRWDDQRHKLTDLGSSVPCPEKVPANNVGGSTNNNNATVSEESVTVEILPQDNKLQEQELKPIHNGNIPGIVIDDEGLQGKDTDSNVISSNTSGVQITISDSETKSCDGQKGKNLDSSFSSCSEERHETNALISSELKLPQPERGCDNVSLSSCDTSTGGNKLDDSFTSASSFIQTSTHNEETQQEYQDDAVQLPMTTTEQLKERTSRPRLKKSKGSEIREDEIPLTEDCHAGIHDAVIIDPTNNSHRTSAVETASESISTMCVINPDGSAEKVVTPDTPKSFGSGRSEVADESFHNKSFGSGDSRLSGVGASLHNTSSARSDAISSIDSQRDVTSLDTQEKQLSDEIITPSKIEKFMNKRSISSPEERLTSTPLKSPGKKRAKRPVLLNLRAVKSVDESDSVDVTTNSKASMLKRHSMQQSPIASLSESQTHMPKPSTPKQKRKFELKVDEFKQDMRELRDKFRRNRGKSQEPEPEDNISYLQEFYKPVEAMDEDATRLWIGKDYTNFIRKDFVELDKPFTDFIDRQETPRMPWHDIAAVVYGKAARDLARHFIQRWNFTKLQKMKKDPRYPMLLPKSYEKAGHVSQQHLSKSIHCNCQVLRSCSEWSAGINSTETSIHNAYVDVINNAKHFIYIENQFFISIMNHEVIENKIAEALYNRIKQAHETGERFRVYVMMPLLPAFEGEIGTSSGTSIQQIINWNYLSICRGSRSLLSKLAAEVGDTTEYISFYGLRKHEELNGKLVSELIYVHSKLMIVDDKTVIIGSANINDRSMLGNRDSEMAIVVEDTQTIRSRMNGQDYRAGKFAASLRRSLFREHLGVTELDTDMDVTDPVVPEFYKNIWVKQAALNTTTYERVFNCIPCDSVRSFQQLYDYQAGHQMAVNEPDKAREQLSKVKGHVVLMSLHFLADESDLSASLGTKEALAPTVVWT